MANRNQVAEIQEMFAAEAKQEEVVEQKVIVDEVEEEVVDEEVVDEVVEETEDEIVDEEAVAEDEDQEVEDVEPEPYTIDSLTKAIDMDVKDFYDVVVSMPDGKDDMTIGDMKNNYTQLLRDKETLETRITEQQQGIDQGNQQQNQLSELEYNAQFELSSIQREFSAVDFDTLETSDPGQAALVRQKFQERWQAAQGALNQASQIHQQEMVEEKQQAHVKMLELIPTWSDAAVLQADQAKMNTAFLSAGYSQNDINAIQDPIALSLMRELVILRDEKQKSAKTLKKLKNAPRPLANSAHGKMKKSTTTEKLVKKAKESKNKHDTLNAVKSLLGAV